MRRAIIVVAVSLMPTYVCAQDMSSIPPKDVQKQLVIRPPLSVGNEYLGMPICKIAYPSDEMIKKNPGYVVVKYTLLDHRKVSDIHILDSKPKGMYDSYVIAYLKKCNITNYLRYPVTRSMRFEFK